MWVCSFRELTWRICARVALGDLEIRLRTSFGKKDVRILMVGLDASLLTHVTVGCYM